MNLWSYPAGAILGGNTLAERTVQPARPVTINDVQHGAEIFHVWPLADLNALGIMGFVEDPIPQDYTPGEPVDIEEGGIIRRTYPAAAPDPVAVANRRRASIQNELAALDLFVPRSVEEIYEANPACGLSEINIGRIARKVELRAELQEMAV